MALNEHNSSIGKNDEWITPKYILDKLGCFDLDPCAAIHMPWETANHVYTIEDDGLNKKWFGRVWLNPPFNRNVRHLWMKKMSEHNNGIMLIPAALETIPFKQYVFGKCSGILALNKRPKFHYVDGKQAEGNIGGTVCLVAYGENNLDILCNSDLGTVLVEYHK